MASSKHTRWFIFGACFLMVMTCLGFCSSPKSLYLAAVTEALGIKRSLFSINDSCRYVTTAIANILFGSFILKFGARKLIAAGFTCLIISNLLYASANNIYVFYAGGVFLGLGLSWTGTTVVGYIINRWFTENRGKLTGFVLAGNGLGGALATQVISPLIYSGDPFGYRSAYLLTAGILLVLGIAVVCIVRDRGENTAPEKKKGKTTWEGIDFRAAVRYPWFWGAAICVFLTGFCLQAVVGVGNAHMKDIGFDPAYIALMLSCHSLALTGSKFLTGVLYDRFGLGKTMLFCESIAIVMILMLAFVTNSAAGMVMAMVYSVFIAFALPLETVMVPLITAELFGEKSYAKALGIMTAINVGGFAFSTPVCNLVFDVLGTYRPIFLIICCIMLGIAVCFSLVLRQVRALRQAA